MAAARPLQRACADCHRREAAVACCGSNYCLLHAHCTAHALHMDRWTVVNSEALKAEQPRVNNVRSVPRERNLLTMRPHLTRGASDSQIRSQVIKDLENELEEVERASAVGGRAAPGATGVSATPRQRRAKPVKVQPKAKPRATFAELNRRTAEQAAKDAVRKAEIEAQGMDQRRRRAEQRRLATARMQREAAEEAAVRQQRDRVQQASEEAALKNAVVRLRSAVEEREQAAKRARLDAEQEAERRATAAAIAAAEAATTAEERAATIGSSGFFQDESLHDAIAAAAAADAGAGAEADGAAAPSEAEAHAASGAGAGGAEEEASTPPVDPFAAAKARIEAESRLKGAKVPTTKEVRDKVSQAIAKSLAAGAESGAGRGVHSATEAALQVLGDQIENALHAKYGDDMDTFRLRARNIMFHLKDVSNRKLRTRILEGDLAPIVLAEMTQEELMSDERKERIAAAKKQQMSLHDLKGDAGTPAAIKCPSCSAMDSKYVYVRGNRDIRKAEIWGSGGAVDDTLIRITCQVCGHQWDRDGV